MKEIEVVRIYIREGDRSGGRDLLGRIFAILHDEHKVHGVTVFRGVAGFGAHGETHAADLLHITAHLPLVIEFFDAPEVVEAALADLQGLIPTSHVVKWPAVCL